MMRSLLLAGALFLHGLALAAQDFEWTVHDLAGASDLTSLAVDSSGTIWAGTSNGLYAYDNGSWTSFDAENGLPSGKINALTVGSDGSVWAGTATGLAYRNVGGEWTKVDGANGNVTAVFFSSASPRTVVWGTPNGELWVVQDGYNGNKPVRVPVTAGPLGYITSIGIFYAPAFGAEIAVFRSTQGLVLTTLDFSQQIGINTTSSDIFPSDIVLCGVERNGVSYDGTDKGLYIAGFDGSGFRTENQGLPSIRVQALAFAGQELWVGTSAGLARRIGSNVREVYSSENSNLPSDDVRAIVVDRSGRIWVGTADGSVSVSGRASSVKDVAEARLTVAPIPAREHATLHVRSTKRMTMEIELVGLDGRRVRTMREEIEEGGSRTIPINVQDLSSGTYVCRVTSGGKTIAEEMLVVEH